MNSLHVSDVNVVIDGSHILQGVTFDVAAGGVTALLGRNGVGKTTTIKAILGLVPRTGVITLAGEQIGALPTHEIVRLGIGYVPEDRELFGSLTIAENLRLAERAGTKPRYPLVFELFPELSERRDQRASTLSGGQQQMVAIARALLNKNDLLLIDEPTKGLSPLLVTSMIEAVRRAAGEATVLLVEQNLDFVTEVAADALVLDRGKIVYTGSAADLLADAQRTRQVLGVGRRDGVA